MEQGLKMLGILTVCGVLALAFVAFATAPAPTQIASRATQSENGPADGLPAIAATPQPQQDLQVVEITALGNGAYDKPQVTVKAGVPVKFRFRAEPAAGCGMQLVIPDYGVNLISRDGSTVEATFTPTKGSHAYRCGMNMFRGVLVAE